MIFFSDRTNAAEGLVQLFLEKEENARREETKAGMKLVMGPIIYFIEVRFRSRHKPEFLHLAGALMENFLEGFALLRYWCINPIEKSNKYKSSFLS